MAKNSEILKIVDRLPAAEPSALIAMLYAPLLGPATGQKPKGQSCEALLEEIAAELPETSKACVIQIKKLAPNTQQWIVLLRAALLRVTDNPTILHVRLLALLNDLAIAGSASARAACIFHAQLARSGDQSPRVLPLAVLARELSAISSRESLAFALKAVELGGGQLVRKVIDQGVKRISLKPPGNATELAIWRS